MCFSIQVSMAEIDYNKNVHHEMPVQAVPLKNLSRFILNSLVQTESYRFRDASHSKQLWSIGTLLCILSFFGPTTFAVELPHPSDLEYFEKNVRPLLAKHCYQCHSKRAKEVQGGLLLDSRASWLEGGESGVSIVPGDLDASLLIRAVRYSDANLQMPPVKSLSTGEIAHLENWVRMGAPGPDEVDIAPLNEPSDSIAGKNHWAYRPIVHYAAPALNSQATVASSQIDAFVQEGLDRKHLRPVSSAKPIELLRRVYFHLIGVPPLPEEVETFLHDESADAIELVVDRLLASPQFGERWGRHWLDLARYADSNGLDENFLFREAWRYRNWVFSQLNEDKPFDRFLLEQIAGDLLPYESIDQRDQQRIAAGFLAIGPKVLLGNNEKNQRMEVADEQIDTIGRAVLGQTLGCARCHDHKFDPIPTADYYAIAGIFASTSVMEMRHMLGQQRLMERLVGLGAQGGSMDDAYEAYWREQPELKKKNTQASAALKALQQSTDEALAELLNANKVGLSELASDPKEPLEKRIAIQQALVEELTAKLDNAPKIPPRAMSPMDVDKPSDEPIRMAGQIDRLGELVPRGGLKVLIDEQPISIQEQESGRIAFARWLTDRNSRAAHLVARVQANRIWHHLMGVGIVRTVDNFGRTGEAPTHPELLDHLAQQLIDSDWSIKSLVRKVVLSRTYMRSSRFDSDNQAIDPENRYLWRAHRRRLDPEAFRDAMLSAAGRLDLKPMESTVSYLGDQATAVGENKVRRRTDFPCRSVYLPVIRNDLPEIFQVFDFADPQTTTGARSKTIVPTQGLFLLNDTMVMDAAESMARRILAEVDSNDVDSKIDRMFDWILNAVASDGERESMHSFLNQISDQQSSDSPGHRELHALAMACHALFASSRFQFLE